MNLLSFEHNVTSAYLKASLELGKEEIPNFTIKFKDESPFMKFVNRYARLFNPDFMTRFHTTIGTTMYLISERDALRNQDNLVDVVLHEMTHMHDRVKYGFIKYNLGYLFPQILAIFALPMLILSILAIPLMPNRISAWIALLVGMFISSVLGAYFISPWVLLFLVPLVALAPFPSPSRTKWERRGYAMSAAVGFWMYKTLLRTPESLVKNFTGWNYYKMCPSREKVLAFLRKDREAIKSGLIQQDMWYRKAYTALQKVQK